MTYEEHIAILVKHNDKETLAAIVIAMQARESELVAKNELLRKTLKEKLIAIVAIDLA